jgi:hypothetical protein
MLPLDSLRYILDMRGWWFVEENASYFQYLCLGELLIWSQPEPFHTFITSAPVVVSNHISPAAGLTGAVADTVAASIPVKLAPEIAGNVAGNLASAIVPVKSAAGKSIPKASIEALVGLVAWAVTLAAGNVTVLLDRSNVLSNLAVGIVPVVILLASVVSVVAEVARPVIFDVAKAAEELISSLVIAPSFIFAEVMALSVIPPLVTFVKAICISCV